MERGLTTHCIRYKEIELRAELSFLGDPYLKNGRKYKNSPSRRVTKRLLDPCFWIDYAAPPAADNPSTCLFVTICIDVLVEVRSLGNQRFLARATIRLDVNATSLAVSNLSPISAPSPSLGRSIFAYRFSCMGQRRLARWGSDCEHLSR